jgi:hypothetical protein
VEGKNKSYTCNNGGNWNISKSLRKYLSNIPVKHEIKEIQKNSPIGLCTHTSGTTGVRAQKVSHGRQSYTYSIL